MTNNGDLSGPKWFRFLRDAFSPDRRAATVITLLLWAVVIFCLFWVLRRSGSFPHAIDLRMATDSNIRLIDYIHTGLWWVAFINLWLGLVLVFTRRFWMARIEAAIPLLPVPGPDLRRRWFWCILIVILLVAGGLRLPRADLSLYNDEAYSLRQYWVGHKVMTERGYREFEPVTWQETLWFNQAGNNHALYSVVGRAAVDTWRWMAGAPEGTFIEAPLRWPAVAAGLGSILVTALLLYQLGFGRAGLLAAALLALHPWHVRYGSEARGYSLALFFGPLVLLAVLQALRTGRARWWAAFGAAQFCLLYSYVGAIYVPLVLNVGLLGWWVWMRLRPGSGYPVWIQFWRWTAANVASAMVFIALMLPSAFQLIHIARYEGRHGELTMDWLRELWSFMVLGVNWSERDPGNPIHVFGESLAGTFPFLQGAVYILVPLLVLAGLGRLGKTGSVGVVLAAPMILVVPLSLRHDNFVHLYWYSVHGLPFLIALGALGWDGLAGFVKSETPRRRLTIGLAVAAVVLYGMITWPQNRVLLDNSKEQLRQVTELIRETGDYFPVDDQEALVFAFMTNISIYDPELWWSFDVDELRQAMAEADREDRALFVTFAERHHIASRYPEMLALIEESGQFEEVAIIYGLETSQYTHYIFRYRGGRDQNP